MYVNRLSPLVSLHDTCTGLQKVKAIYRVLLKDHRGGHRREVYNVHVDTHTYTQIHHVYIIQGRIRDFGKGGGGGGSA